MTTTRLDARDRQLLSELVVEFAWRVDHQMAHTMHELVTDDVEIRLANSTMLDKNDVIKWGAARDASTRATSHLMTNLRFTLADDGTVIGSSIALIFRHDGEGLGPAIPWAVTEYDDVFVRVGEDWKFASRVSKDLFSPAPRQASPTGDGALPTRTSSTPTEATT